MTETGLLLDRFAAYLASERGLAPTTVTLNVRLAARSCSSGHSNTAGTWTWSS